MHKFVEDEKNRNQIFQENVKFVLESNDKPAGTFALALNEFADWTHEELENYRKGLNPLEEEKQHFDDDSDSKEDENAARRELYELYLHDVNKKSSKRRYGKRFIEDLFHDVLHPDKTNYDNIVLPDSFDWREKNLVSSIKNQLTCGSCYAFATVAVLETLYAWKNNLSEVIDFSPQQLVDCSTGNSGCKGGLFGPSIRYLKKNGGKLSTLASYPYTSQADKCQTTDTNQINLGKLQYRSIPTGNEVILAKALTIKGPIFVGLNTDSKLFTFYKEGIYKVDNCSNSRASMDHALTLVGYGFDKELQLPYWIIKNSYGEKWGEKGYLRLAKDNGNMCGITTMASFAEMT
ncbi:unnamed protein product [Rotaria sp. Silwood2]|nr:unnamed protein product [Rotaria sp. Silwood2]CAF2663282.1 unnamed protein product [Rotaria sp. Silwood2]CAF3074038.1 unnamed protein product [Rotaria sp. Silwood2]CAF4190631.1 unnamed protein product [Rotaria sp. Silwood2]CAF4243089.1 unnamed protein product [Rotaria sp. Silwood2]